MLNIAWTEIMVVAAIALIVVGPKDLPVMLRQLGKMFGTVRRMGNEFKTEINKVAALDEVKDIKNSITAPLKETHTELTDQFNAIGKDGVEPSGAIKPAVDGQESVADEIRESAGMKTKSTATHDPKAAADSMKNAIARAQETQAEKKAAAAAAAKAKKPATRRKPAAKKATTAKPAAAKTTRTKSTASKPAPKTAAKPVAKKPAPKRAPAKPATKAPAKPAASKPAPKRAAAKSTTAKAAASKTAAKPAAKPKRAPRKKPATASKDT